jgi:general secretion pathway protein D
MAEREINRRASLLKEAETLLLEADQLQTKGSLEEALRLYRQVWDMLPEAPMTADLRLRARDGYSQSAVALARRLAAEGRYSDARALLNGVLAEGFNPDDAEAKELLVQLDDPDRHEPALSPEHVANVTKVQTLLRDGYSFLNLGDYDNAKAKFHEVLRIDRYNAAARRALEMADEHRANYYDAARDSMRAGALAEVDQSWEKTVPIADISGLFGNNITLGSFGGYKQNPAVKMRTIILPRVDLQGASLEEVIEFLRIRSREIDPEKRGVDFVLKVSDEDKNRPVTISVKDVPLEEALRYVTEMTGMVYRMDEFAVTITSRSEKSTTLITKTYRVPPDFIQNAAASDQPAAGAGLDPFAQGGATTPPSGLNIRRLGAREFLEERGIVFGDGATASYNASTNILFVKNTAENLGLVDSLVETVVNASPKQVEIQVRLLEVNETRLKELGFDWLLGQFNVPGSDRIFAGGGTTGNQRGSFTDAEFPFAPPGGGSLVGGNPITSGLRSTGALAGVQTIDSLIGRVNTVPVESRSASAFAVAGVFTDPQFQVVMRALNQSKGLDLLASPTVVTKSGQRTNVTVSREFRYPTEFDPPQIPQTLSTVIPGGPVNYLYGTSDFAPITPTTPTAFEKRDVGIVLEVEPVIGDNNRTVDLNLVPSSTEFEGFIDYAPDITNTVPGPGNSRIPYVIDNDVLQPIFRSNKVSTSVTVWDGYTVVLGGVMSESIKDINDKVPLLGDVPVIGRAFTSKVSTTERKNVIFFVTVKVIDPGGSRVNQAVATEATAAR